MLKESTASKMVERQLATKPAQPITKYKIATNYGMCRYKLLDNFAEIICNSSKTFRVLFCTLRISNCASLTRKYALARCYFIQLNIKLKWRTHFVMFKHGILSVQQPVGC